MTLGTLYNIGPLCPFSHRALIAASELDVAIDTVTGAAIPQAVRDGNSGGTWPIFIRADNGATLDDSALIVEHFIASSGAAGERYRSDAQTLGTLNQLIQAISKVILSADPDVQTQFRAKLDAMLDGVAALLRRSGGPFVQGEQFSQADGHVTPFLYRLPFITEVRGYTPPLLRDNASIATWVEQATARPSFQAIAPSHEALRAFYAQKAQR